MDCRFGYVKGKSYWEILSSLKGVVLTSSYEGMPLVMLEALAVGTPFYTTKNGAEESLKALGLDERLYVLDGKGGEEVMREWERAFKKVRKVRLPSWDDVGEKMVGKLREICSNL